MAELKTAAALKSLANASRLPKTFQAQTLEQSCCSFQNSFLESPSDNFTILFNSLAARRRPYQPAPEIFCRSLRIWHPMKYVMLWMRYGSTLAAILQSDNHCQSIIHYLKQQHRSPVKYIMIRGFISPLSRCTQRQLWFYLPRHQWAALTLHPWLWPESVNTNWEQFPRLSLAPNSAAN